ncbi:MAG: PAS domain-containing protein [Gammaproteobacteria bacterium]|nr:PAS domain-containing protein [Gammaproteobacteria bacterium]
MPEMTGLDVLQWVSENTPEQPIIVISGAGVINDVAEALRHGAWDYLFKPIEDLSILKHAVNRVLERSALIKANKNYQENLESEVINRTQALIENQNKLIASEKLVIEKQNYLQGALNAAKAGTLFYDINNNQLVWDKLSYAIFDIVPEEFIPVYESWRQYVHPDDIEAVEQNFNQALLNPNQLSFEIEYRIVIQQSQLRWVKVSTEIKRLWSNRPV